MTCQNVSRITDISAGGKITSETISRHSVMVGHLGKEIGKIYNEKITEDIDKERQEKQSFEPDHSDIESFVEL